VRVEGRPPREVVVAEVQNVGRPGRWGWSGMGARREPANRSSAPHKAHVVFDPDLGRQGSYLP
jgi:hypothetical protein